MSAIVIFLVLVAAVAGWWLAHQRLMARPWLEVGPIDDDRRIVASRQPTGKVGVEVLLVVIGSLFTLLVSAYLLRSGLPDWHQTPVPQVLWLNTGLLILASIAMQLAVVASRRGDESGVRSMLAAAGLASLAFLGGQLVAWGELLAAGYFAATNPANAFFYLVTAIHGLHVAGGLVVLGWAMARVFAAPRRAAAPGQSLTLELCALYWHFLLIVWLVLLSLLTGWADDFVEICRGLVS